MFNMPDDCRYSSDLDQDAALNMTRDTDVVLDMYCPHCEHLLRWYLANNQYEARCYHCGAIFQKPYDVEKRRTA